MEFFCVYKMENLVKQKIVVGPECGPWSAVFEYPCPGAKPGLSWWADWTSYSACLKCSWHSFIMCCWSNVRSTRCLQIWFRANLKYNFLLIFFSLSLPRLVSEWVIRYFLREHLMFALLMKLHKFCCLLLLVLSLSVTSLSSSEILSSYLQSFGVRMPGE